MYDVMVVGAGPVGSYLACRLAKLGYRVVVFERRPGVGDAVCCTGIIGKECFDRLPFATNTVLAQSNSAKFFTPSGRYLRLSKETTQAYIVDRVVFDRALVQRAQESGAEYRVSSRVEDIAISSDCVKAVVDCKGVKSDLRGRVAVLSNGFGGSLSQKLGLGKINDFVLGAQAEVNVRKLDEVEVYFGQEVAPGFFAWLVPTSQGRALAGLLSRRSPGLFLKNLLSKLVAQGKIVSAGDRIAYGVVPMKPLPKTFRERVLVVGDAAGQVKPTTGGGIYYGLLCADIAAEVLREALAANDLSARRLSSYEKLWRKKLAKELEVGYWARKLYEKLNDNQIERIFDIVQEDRIHETLLRSPDFSFDWHSASILRAFKDKPLSRAFRSMTILSPPPKK